MATFTRSLIHMAGVRFESDLLTQLSSFFYVQWKLLSFFSHSNTASFSSGQESCKSSRFVTFLEARNAILQYDLVGGTDYRKDYPVRHLWPELAAILTNQGSLSVPSNPTAIRMQLHSMGNRLLIKSARPWCAHCFREYQPENIPAAEKCHPLCGQSSPPSR